MRISVIGTGHVGLVTCVTFAHLGHEVIGIDADRKKIDVIKGGVSPFFEPRVEELLQEGLASGRLSFTTAPEEAIPDSSIVFVCVGTPPKITGEASLIYVEQAARMVAKHANGRTLVVEKSTVPAGTAQKVRMTLRNERPDLSDDLDVASNPEFLREGRAVEDTLVPDRILVGVESEWGRERFRELYQPLTDQGFQLIETDITTAEMSKHASNAFLALKISFANALADMCELTGADVSDVTHVMGADHRIGPHFLEAGMGYGGSCFPKDVQAFEQLARSLGYDFALLTEVERINREAIERVSRKIREALWNLEGKRIALLGLAFKPGTDDLREAPAMKLARRLVQEGAEVVGFDPQAIDEAQRELPELKSAGNAYDAVKGAHCAVVCTEWDEFRAMDLAKMRDVMAYPIVVDGRNIFDVDEMAAAGFSYYPTGKRSTTATPGTAAS
jgi:UDPglucose 6-dehydrogenase